MKTRLVTIYENRQGLAESEAKARHGVIDDYILDPNGVVYRFKVSGMMRRLSKKILTKQAKGKVTRLPVWGGSFKLFRPIHAQEDDPVIPMPVMADGEENEFALSEIYFEETPRDDISFPLAGGNIAINSEIIRYRRLGHTDDHVESYVLYLELGDRYSFNDYSDKDFKDPTTITSSLALGSRGLFAEKIGLKEVVGHWVIPGDEPVEPGSLWDTREPPAISAFMDEHQPGDEILQVLLCDDSERSDFPRIDEVEFSGDTGSIPDIPFTVTGAISGVTATVTHLLGNIPGYSGSDNGVLTVIDATGPSAAEGELPSDFEVGESITSGAWSADVEEHRVGDGSDLSSRNNPLNVFLQLLLSTGSAGSNGKYDTLRAGFGIGIPQDLVDIEAIERLRDDIFGASKINFVVTEPMPFKEFFEKNLFKFLQVFPFETPDGQISLSYLYTEAEAAVLDDEVGLVSIDGDSIEATSLPDWSAGQIPVTKVEIKYNKHPTEDDYFSKLTVNFARAQNLYGDLGRTIKLETGLLYLDHTTLAEMSPGDPELPELMGRMLDPMWSRHSSHPVPIIKARAPYSKMTLSVGELVKLTHPSLPNLRTSQRGFTDEYFQILGGEPDPEGGLFNLTLWQVGVHDLKYARKAPSAMVFAYTADGGGAGKAKIDTFRTVFAKTSQMDLDHFKVGDKVAFLTDTYDPEGALTSPEIAEIESITADDTSSYIILTTNLTDPPSSRHLVELWDYDNQLSVHKTTRIWLADINRLLGAADDTAFKYR
jgi:hypothetical protein